MLVLPIIALGPNGNPRHLSVEQNAVGRACRPHDAPAAIVDRVKPFSGPPMALLSFTPVIRVTVSPTGFIESLVVERSTGNAAYDQSAMLAARRSTYRSRCFEGIPVVGTARYQAFFGSGS